MTHPLPKQIGAETIGTFCMAFACCCVCHAHQSAHAATAGGVPLISYRVVHAYPHRADAFTQGFELTTKGRVVESVGRYGHSGLALIDLASGGVLREIKLPGDLFGEGATVFGDYVYQLTWRAGKAFAYNRNTLVLRKTFRYEGEGWGLTHNGEHLIMSNGTADLVFRTPGDFKEVRRVTVTEQGEPRTALNELEWIRGFVFANVWLQERIVLINPRTGEVRGQIDLAPLRKRQRGNANGIAWHGASQSLLVTGKNWSRIFALRLKSLPKPG